MENNGIPKKKSRIGSITAILALLIIVLTFAAFNHQSCKADPVSGSNPCAPKDPTAMMDTASTSIKTPAKSMAQDSSPTPKTSPEPLSQAIENYSDSTASNVDVLGTISDVIPQESGITSAYGNTIIVKDGQYTAAVHQIKSKEFQNLVIGDWVEVQGGYMQGEPGTTRVEIVRTGSVTVRLSAAYNPH